MFVPPVVEVAPGTSAAIQMTYESKWSYWLDLAVRSSSPGAGITILGVAPRVLVGPRRTIVHDVIVQVAAGTPSADYPLSIKASFGSTKETALGIVRVKASSPPPPPPGPPPPSGETRRLTVDAKGGLTVTSSPSGIACPGDCTEDYQKDTQVTLTASSANAVWTGCPAPLLERCFVTMDTDRNVIVSRQDVWRFGQVRATARPQKEHSRARPTGKSTPRA